MRRDRGEKNGSRNYETIDPSLNRCNLSLRIWAMKKKRNDPSITFVLTNGWNDIVRQNFIKEDVLQIYTATARTDRKLWFLLVRLPSIEDLRQSEQYELSDLNLFPE